MRANNKINTRKVILQRLIGAFEAITSTTLIRKSFRRTKTSLQVVDYLSLQIDYAIGLPITFGEEYRMEI